MYTYKYKEIDSNRMQLQSKDVTDLQSCTPSYTHGTVGI